MSAPDPVPPVAQASLSRIGPGNAISPCDLPDEAQRLAGIATETLARLARARLAVATAESCTGGLLASLLTDIEGLGSVFDRGFVTYTDAAKREVLGIEGSLIARHGAVSAEVARAMAQGALDRSQAGLAVAITGFAGPAGPRDEAGLVHLAVCRREGPALLREAHYGALGRDRVRLLAAGAALEMIGEVLQAASL